MGCRTGFYLLVRNAVPGEVREVTKKVLARIIAHDGGMFGQSEEECGNYRELDLEAAKAVCREYLAILDGAPESFVYPTGGAL